MAGESDDPSKQRHLDSEQDEPKRPDSFYQWIAWPQNGSMPENNKAAQQTFERNSKELQQRAAERQQESSNQREAPEAQLDVLREKRGQERSQGFDSLKAEQAEELSEGRSDHDRSRSNEKGRDEGKSDELTFLRDRSSRDRPRSDDKSRDNGNGDELTFLRDRSPHDHSRGR